MNEPKNEKLWFRAKRYGWGWQPVTWQGWLATGLYVALLVLEFKKVGSLSHSGSDTLISFALPFVLITTLFIMLCYGKGERPYWRWGGK